MVSRFEQNLRHVRTRGLTAVGLLLVSGLLASCSTVPDAVNPVEWYKSASDLVTGDDHDKDPAPEPSNADFPDVNKPIAADTRKGLAEALPADKDNAKYAEPVRRAVTPTKPLARRTPAPATTQTAQAPAAAVPPKPVVVSQQLPAAPAAAPTPAPAAATARDDGPDAPPASMDMAPPPSAGIPETVPARGPRRLQEQFERRLAESAQQSVRPGQVATAESGAYRLREEEPIHLIPPSSQRPRKGGGKGMAAPEPEPMPAASFQVASVDFRADSAELTAADRASVAEVARLYKQTGGMVRVVGHAPSLVMDGDEVGQMMGGLDASMKRANAVARELTKRGVPARKILVGSAPDASDGIGAQIYLDVM